MADYVGDSLGLSREAADTDASAIVFCGVHFMAETAKILSPEKTVLIPDLDAGCSLAASITADQLRAWKAEHPGATVVSYVNTTAEVKSESDYCCTSGNAKAIDRADSRGPGDPLPARPLPRRLAGEGDGPQAQHLDGRVPRPRGHPPGRHRALAGGRARRRVPRPPRVRLREPVHGFGNKNTHILGTESMIKFAKQSPKERFLIATETGIIHRLKKDVPGKTLRGRLRGRDLQVHEDDHAREAARLAARLEVRGRGGAGDRREGAAGDPAHGRHRLGAFEQRRDVIMDYVRSLEIREVTTLLNHGIGGPWPMAR